MTESAIATATSGADPAEHERGLVSEHAGDQTGDNERTRARDTYSRSMRGNRTRLRITFQGIGNGLQTGHISPRPADPGCGAQDNARPKSVRNKRQPKMRQRGQAGTNDIDITRGNAVGQGDKHGNGNDVGREEDADQPPRLGLGQMPLLDDTRQQCWKGESADLHQHLSRDDRPNELTGRVLAHSWAFYSAARGIASAVSLRCNANKAINAARLRPADTATTHRPIGSINSPKPSGAKAWQMRDGAPISPSR